MREIKFRYKFKRKTTGFIVVKTFSIEEIESGFFGDWFDNEVKENYESAGLEDFELFWDNKPVSSLNKTGLLRL